MQRPEPNGVERYEWNHCFLRPLSSATQVIVDCHTQMWDPEVRVCIEQMAPAFGTGRVISEAASAMAAGSPVDRAIVLGFKSCYLDAGIPNQHVADYVKRNGSRMVGFAGIDPRDPECLEELRSAHEDLHLKGITVSPAMQDYHPCDTLALRVYEDCARRALPILFQYNTSNPAAKLEYARPMLLDEVAREFPGLRIVVAHMGYPWVDETIVLLAKHKHVYAEVSGLLTQPWTAYNALLSAYQYGVIDKLLFGSDYPFQSPASCIEALYSVNQLSQGTNLGSIPREQLRGIVERDTLTLLGIETGRPAREARKQIIDVEE